MDLRWCRQWHCQQLELKFPLLYKSRLGVCRGKRLNHPTILAKAKKDGNKKPAQVLIRWSLQHGLVVILKSIHEDRIRENSKVFDFQLGHEDMKLLDSLNENFQTVFLG
jgi:methylglyoxal/glyoxal reductase